MVEYINYVSCRKECIICFQDRRLKNFCKEHKFCERCCKEWGKKSMLCPCCRKVCINKKFLTYNYELVNMDYEAFKDRYEFLFYFWHKQQCIKEKHKFIITKSENHFIFYCFDCHIEQVLLN